MHDDSDRHVAEQVAGDGGHSQRAQGEEIAEVRQADLAPADAHHAARAVSTIPPYTPAVIGGAKISSSLRVLSRVQR